MTLGALSFHFVSSENDAVEKSFITIIDGDIIVNAATIISWCHVSSVEPFHFHVCVISGHDKLATRPRL